MRRLSLLSAALLLSLAGFGEIRSEVVRFEIERREPFAGGHGFGDVGEYERIIGRVYYEIDPDLPQNDPIIDLDLAPRNEHGKVEFDADLFILAPRDLSKAGGTVLYDVNNRGNMLALRFFNDAPGTNDPKAEADAGNGFLLRHGFILVWSGWNGELLPGGDRLRLNVPLARGEKDAPITGPVRNEIVPDKDATRLPVTRENHGTFRPTPRGLETGTLTHRERAADPRVPIPRDQWTLHVTEVQSDSPPQLPLVELELPAGLKRGHIYEVIYEAQGPQVHGVCFAAVRDLISALRHGTGENNPLLHDGKPAVERAHGFGVSQSGRFLREFLYWGFNQDEQRRKVFDGVIPHVAGGGLGSFNHRFAQPTRHVGQHDQHDYPADRFPFAYDTQRDPLSGQEEGILRRSLETDTAPLLLHTQSSAEYWTRSGSLPHTDPLGTRDAQPPDNVRFYSFGGTQHGPSAWSPDRGDGQNLRNPGDYRPFLRALLLALDRWASEGTTPPPSVYPRIDAGTLVSWEQESTSFPAIPRVRYPDVIQQPPLFDLGPRWQSERIIGRQPPRPLGDYRVLVPRSDADGNDLGCLLPPEVAVPVATYTGWNLRNQEAGAENELVSLMGSYIPFLLTRSEREQAGDPRPSLQERYRSLDDYLGRLAAACRELESAGYLLSEDAERILAVQRERVAPCSQRFQRDSGFVRIIPLAPTPATLRRHLPPGDSPASAEIDPPLVSSR